MKILLLIILAMPSIALATFPQVNSCTKNKEWIKKKIDRIVEISEERDASDAIAYLKRVVSSSCPKNIKDQVNASANQYIIEGLRNHVSFMKAEAKRVANFRAPKEEIQEIARVRQKLADLGEENIPSGLTSSQKTTLLTQGRVKSNARKSSCTNVDNRNPPLVDLNTDGSVKTNNMRNQDSIGWCYAYTAADLISHKIGINVSAVDIANAYNEGSLEDWFSNEESTMEGGYSDTAANNALSRGLCLESQLPSDDYNFSAGSKNLMEELKAIEKLYDTYNDRVSHEVKGYFYNSVERKTGEQLTKAHNGFKSDLMCGSIQSDWDEFFKNMNINEFMNVLKNASSSNDFIDDLIEKNCKPRIELSFDLEYDSFSSYSKDYMMTRIDDRLDDGEILGINYKSTVLSDKYDHSDGNHASLVVARKYNKSSGSCEYLIRNSWGSGCSKYDIDYGCEQGNIWVPEEYFRQAVYGVTYED